MEKPPRSSDLNNVPATYPAVPAFTNTVLMCGKCCRKLGDDGKALRKRVKNAVHNLYGAGAGVQKTDCFSLCPKGGQVLATSARPQSRRVVIIEPGSDVERAIAYLLEP